MLPSKLRARRSLAILTFASYLPRKMKLFSASSVLLAASMVVSLVVARDPPKTLQVGVKHKPADCVVKTQRGDKLAM